jgi:hypothetical protein
MHRSETGGHLVLDLRPSCVSEKGGVSYSPKRPHRPWGLPVFLFNAYRGSFLWA